MDDIRNEVEQPIQQGLLSDGIQELSKRQMEDVTGGASRHVPTEQISLNFERIRWTYTR